MAVTPGAAGAGANGSVLTITPGFPAGITAGDLLLLPVILASDTATITTPSGFENISGPDVFSGATSYLFGKIATGSEAGTLNVTGSDTSFKQARIYDHTGNETSSVTNAIESLSEPNGTTSPITMPTVTTSLSNSLAVALACSDCTGAVGSATGETGGDWTETETEYQSGIAQLERQTATMAAAGTISGGSFTATPISLWINYGLGVKPPTAAVVVDTQPRRYQMRRRRATSW